jgi:hypothetical protein
MIIGLAKQLMIKSLLCRHLYLKHRIIPTTAVATAGVTGWYDKAGRNRLVA